MVIDDVPNRPVRMSSVPTEASSFETMLKLESQPVLLSTVMVTVVARVVLSSIRRL